MRLKTKVFLVFLAVALVSGGFLTVLSKRVVRAILMDEVSKRGLLKAVDLPQEAAAGFAQGGEALLLPLLQAGLVRTGALYAIALNQKGDVLAHTNVVETGKRYHDPATQEALSLDRPAYRSSSAGGQSVVDLSLPVWAVRRADSGEEFLLLGGKETANEATRLGTLRLGFPMGEALEAAGKVSNQIIWMIVAMGVLILGIIFVFLQGILQRLQLLSEGTRRISRGEYGAKIPVLSKDELGDLARSFNQMSEQLAQRNELILSAAGEGIYGLDLEGKATFVNPAAARMLGYEIEELIGKPVHSIARSPGGLESSPPGGHQAIYASFAHTDVHSVADELFWRKDNDSFPVEYVGTPIRERDQIVGAVVIFKDITERKTQAAALEYQATHDTLTGLANRTLLYDRLEQAILAGKREEKPVALLVLDLDHFKEVNDTLGHSMGDTLLQQVGARIQAVLRASNTVARLGGDEFAVLLPETGREGAITASQKILRGLERPFTLNGLNFHIGASIGVALFPIHGEGAALLLQRADVAMYAAKQEGSGCVLYTAEHDQFSPRRLVLMGELRSAIDQDQLFLQYQPKVTIAPYCVTGVEALVRWEHPQYGTNLPDQFIGIAEQTGLIEPLTFWVLNVALRQCRAWHEAGVKVSVAVNLSARNLQDSRFPDEIADLLRRHQLEGKWLELEITESVIMSDPARAIATLTRLNKIGVRFSIDDFGIGYSSLSYLRKLPVEAIKIDKSFVREMNTNEGDSLIVRSIIDLSHHLGLKVIAEGVENREIWDHLARLRCDAAQGYSISSPVSAEEFSVWFANAQ
ncbi:MAG: EAL domain-containing protein [Nitrospirae bacterium]|nr:EAL domain-containing protein [Candidatus Manganitrophaceae bacterium]